MKKYIKKPITSVRLNGLPREMRLELKESRRKHGWSQAELGRRAGLPQMHISGIESGKIVPRFDTLLDLVRVLDYDLLMVPRALVPAVQALIRDRGNQGQHRDEGERSLYAADDESEPEERRHDEV
jgi:transcriptional regulator with XRE-family HTH domain